MNTPRVGATKLLSMDSEVQVKSKDTPLNTSASPVEDFSQCHVGIVGQLEALSDLPALADAASKARTIAETALKFFDDAIGPHHADEERELIPALKQSATPGDEAEKVRVLSEQIVAEHRGLEALWERIRPQLKRIAGGQRHSLDSAAVEILVRDYKAHAQFEESDFLPLAKTILGRKGKDLAALGMAIHIRHNRDKVLPYI